tara:strand:- start:789 stop:1187 length:399 start_codon:yes stop_codon:yes gene_type:complete
MVRVRGIVDTLNLTVPLITNRINKQGDNMRFKLKSGLKIKLRDLSLDEKDSMLDSLQYETDSDGEMIGIKNMYSTITKWLRIGLDGDISDEYLEGLSIEDRFEAFLKLQEHVIKTQDFSVNRLLNIDDLLKN